MVKYVKSRFAAKGRKSRKRTRSVKRRSFKVRNYKLKKFSRSKKHTLVCGPSVLTGPQMPRILNAIRSSHSVSDNLIQDLRQAVDLSKDGTIYGEVMDHLKTMHTTGTNTPYVNFLGIRIRALRQSVDTRVPIIVVEHYPDQGTKSYAFTSGKTYIKCLSDNTGHRIWPRRLYVINVDGGVSLKYYYKLSKPGYSFYDVDRVGTNKESSKDIYNEPLTEIDAGNAMPYKRPKLDQFTTDRLMG